MSRSESQEERRSEVRRPEKELWPGVTKAELATHWRTVAPYALPHLRDRPLTLLRAPDGIPKTFYQKQGGTLPSTLERCEADPRVHHVMADDAEDLRVLSDQACIELHGWTSRCDKPAVPDRLVFDLDPPDMDMFDVVQEVAARLCRLVKARGGTPHPLLTGSKGIHVVVPLVRQADYDAITEFTTAVGEALCRRDDRLTMQVRKNRRGGRVFVDTLRNRRRQTSVIPWSPRARAGAPFALPITVADLEDPLDPRQARVPDVAAWTDKDPWEGFRQDAVPLATLANA